MNKLIGLLLLMSLVSCSPQNEPGNDNPEDLFGNNWRKKIDYSSPEKYLVNVEQSAITSDYIKIIRDNLSVNQTDYSGIVKVLMFKDRYFTSYSGGGAYIGKLTINDLFRDKKLSGCHDHALVVAGVLRFLGYPVVMVDCADINWAQNYPKNPDSGFIGHVFLEVFVENKWILLDPTGGFFSTVYDHDSPVIRTQYKAAVSEFYVIFKGLDTNEYGIFTSDELNDNLKAFANNLGKIDLESPVYTCTNYIDYFISEINSFEKKNKIDLTVNFKYTGKYNVDADHQIIIQIDHFKNGFPISQIKADQAQGQVSFNNIYVAVDVIYLIGWLDNDSSGAASAGDPTLRQLDSNNDPVPVCIINGAVVVNVEFDDSLLWPLN